MARAAEFTYVESKALEYADAYRAAGFRAVVAYRPDGSVYIETWPPLSGGMVLGLALSESLPGLEGRC